MTRSRTDLALLWCGPAGVLIAGLGIVVGHLLPPPDPGASAAELARFWGEHTDARRLGCILIAVGSMGLVPWGAVLAKVLHAAEGQPSALGYAQVAGATLSGGFGVLYAFVMMAITYRPGRDPDIVQALTDVAWLPFVGLWMTAFLQAVVLGLGVLAHHGHGLPRWLGYFCLWYALSSLSGSLVVFFKDGPFAWNGVFAFYFGAGVFFGWILATFVAVRRTLLDCVTFRPG